MSFWYDIKNKNYASNEKSSWLRAYIDRTVSEIRSEISSAFSAHTKGTSEKHKADVIECSDGKSVQTFVVDTNTALSQKVDKISGKGLSTNDYNNTEKAEVAKIKDKVDKVSGKSLIDDTFAGNVDSKKIVLSNGDESSTIVPKSVKLIGQGQASAEIESDAITVKSSDGNTEITPTGVMAGSKTDSYAEITPGEVTAVKAVTSDGGETVTTTHKLSEKANKSDLAGKVDKVSGKGLSSNDYTDAAKNVVDAITLNSETSTLEISKSVKLAGNGAVTSDYGNVSDTLKVGYLGDNKWAFRMSAASGFSSSGDVTTTLDNITVHRLSQKANKSDVLIKTNTAKFTPTGDYQPATKKYVDDIITALRSELGLE